VNELEFLLSKIRDVPDFPQPGILFKDITPLLQDREALRVACRLLAQPFRDRDVSVVVGIESRGFIFGPPVALELGVGFVPARKPGKLPWKTVEEIYDLEYGLEGRKLIDGVEIHSILEV
jgi:adenine phosphoribosyltransferase